MYKSAVEDLQKNPAWQEIVSTLKEVQAGLIFDLQDMDPFGDGATKIARQQGRLKMLEFVLSIPDDILREIEEDNKREADKEERKEGAV